MEAPELQREKLGRLPERRGSAGAWGGKSKTATGSRAQCARDRTQARQGTEGLRLSSAVGADGILRVDALPPVLVTLATAVRIAPYFIFQATRPIAREDRYSMDPFPLADCAMPNIGSLLKSEISRLARREVRQETQPLRKAGAGYRREIAALKRKIAALQRQANQFAKARSSFAAGETPSSQSPTRFVAKGLRALRMRLGLSAAELARLLGVSMQSVYNWERKKTVPRRSQVATIVALRAINKKEARARLEQIRKPRKAAKTRRPVRPRKRST